MTLLNASSFKPLGGGPSYSLRHRLFRATWNVIWFIFASWTPPQLRPWRRLLLRAFGAKIASTANVYSSARIWYPPHLTMAARAALGPNVNCYCMAPIELGEHVVVSQGSFLCAGSHDIEDADFQLVVRPIRICADAWIAAEAFVGPGVTVGQGAVIGARAVLLKDAEPQGIYIGNPAVLIKYRKLKKLRA